MACDYPWMRGPRTIISFCMAMYSYIEIYQTFADNQRTTLDLSFSPPDDRCVPFFDLVKHLPVDPLPKSVLYTYDQGVATVRLCTNASRQEADEAFGESYFYDSLKVATEGLCSLSDPAGVTVAAALCESASPDVDCAAAFYTPPAPYGIMWQYGLTLVESDVPNVAPTQPTNCSVRVRRFEDVQPCTMDNVFAYQKTNSFIRAIFIVAFVFGTSRAVLEILGVWTHYKKGEVGFFYQLADDGTCGPIYTVFLMCKSQEYPEAKPYTLGEWFTIQSLEAVANIAMPAAAMSGCSFSSNLQLMVLLIFGITKSVALMIWSLIELKKGQCGVCSASKSVSPSDV